MAVAAASGRLAGARGRALVAALALPAWAPMVALAACVHAVGAAPATAQVRVTSARFVADLAGEVGTASVRVEYALTGAAPGDSVAVTLLDFGAGVPLEVQVGRAGQAARLQVAQGAAYRAHLPVEATGDGGALLSVAYFLPLPATGFAESAMAYLPVLTVDGAPEAARAGLFQAEVSVPSEWRITEAFPTGLGAAAAGGALRTQLPVVPSVVTLRFRADGGRGIPLMLLVNLFAGACLALVGVAGWRQLAPGGRNDPSTGDRR